MQRNKKTPREFLRNKRKSTHFWPNCHGIFFQPHNQTVIVTFIEKLSANKIGKNEATTL